MQFSFSDASAVQVVAPTASTRNSKVMVAAHKQSLHTISNKVGLAQPAAPNADSSAGLAQAQPLTVEPSTVEPLTVVKQTIDALEAQGLLMLFDRHDQVAKRLTEDLTAAGVLPELPIESSVTTPLESAETALDSE